MARSTDPNLPPPVRGRSCPASIVLPFKVLQLCQIFTLGWQKRVYSLRLVLKNDILPYSHRLRDNARGPILLKEGTSSSSQEMSDER